MSDLGALFGLKRRETGNRLRLFFQRGRFKLVVVTFFSLLFWYGLFRLFGFAFWLLKIQIGFADYVEPIIETVFHVFFMVLTLMLIFSNGIIGYGSYFRSRETGFLLSLPVRPDSVFLYKFTECLTFSSWAFVFLVTPLMAAFVRAFERPWWHFFASLPFFFVYLFIPAAIGAGIAFVITIYLPRTRKGLLVILGVLLAAGLMWMVWELVKINSGVIDRVKVARDVLTTTDFTRHPLVPSTWLARGVLNIGKGGQSWFLLGVITANAFFLTAFLYTLSNRWLLSGWFRVQGLRRAKRYGDHGLVEVVLERLLFFLRPPVRLIVVKDAKAFFRDPVQWSQFLIFFGLLCVYFLNLRTFHYEERPIQWKHLIAQLNLFATALTLSTFASRFIYPQLSLEGRRFWVIGTVPIPREEVLYGKLALSFTMTILVSEGLIAVSSWMLGTPVELAVLHMVTLLAICNAISGLAVGLGARYPNFSEESPSKIVSGFGGTLNLVLGLAVVILILVVQAYPCFRFYLGTTTPSVFRRELVVSVIVMAGISLAVGLIPMVIGLKAIRRLEI